MTRRPHLTRCRGWLEGSLKYCSLAASGWSNKLGPGRALQPNNALDAQAVQVPHQNPANDWYVRCPISCRHDVQDAQSLDVAAEGRQMVWRLSVRQRRRGRDTCSAMDEFVRLAASFDRLQVDNGALRRLAYGLQGAGPPNDKPNLSHDDGLIAFGEFERLLADVAAQGTTARGRSWSGLLTVVCR
jgi:hypothetical protein